MSVSGDVSIGSRSVTSTTSCVMPCAVSPTCDVVSAVTVLAVTHGASACQSELSVVMDLSFTPVAGQWWENLQLTFEQPLGLLNCQHASFPSSLRHVEYGDVVVLRSPGTLQGLRESTVVMV
jgi:hypothetical protein